MYISTGARTKQCSAESLNAEIRLIAKEHGIRTHALLCQMLKFVPVPTSMMLQPLLTIEIGHKLMLHEKIIVSGM
jgi:hypothetical protein